MTDLQDMRARMRDARQPSVPADGGTNAVTFWIVAACAVVLGFSVVLFTPRIYSVQRTSAIPTFKDTRDRIEAEAKGELAPVALRPLVAPLPNNPTRYAGKNPEQMGKIADEVCFHRAQAIHPHWAKTPRLSNKDLSDFADRKEIKFFDALMHCLVTEAPGRYCSGTQRDMIKAEIAMYFRAVEHANVAMKTVAADVKAAQQVRARNGLDPDPEAMGLSSFTFTLDEKVLAGVEGLMRAGYLTAAQRSDINTIAPRPVRERFARVVGSKAPCAENPWWAIWR